MTRFAKIRLRSKALAIVRLRGLHKPGDWHPDRYDIEFKITANDLCRETGASFSEAMSALSRAISRAAQARQRIGQPRRRR